MPGREDFAKVMATALTDERVLRAAELYVERGIAKDATALAAVLGHIACISLWTTQRTNDGRLPGDGVAVVRVAAACAPKTARIIVEILTDPSVDLLTRDGDAGKPLRQRGYSDAYESIIARREKDAAKKRERRQSPGTSNGTSHSASLGTSVGTSPPMSGSRGEKRREEENPPSPPDGGGSSAAPPVSNDPPQAGQDDRPLTRAELSGLRAALRTIKSIRDVDQRVRDRVKAVESGMLPPAAIRQFVAECVMTRPGARMAYFEGKGESAG